MRTHAQVLTLSMFVVTLFQVSPFSTFAETCTGSRRPIQPGDIEKAKILGITIAPGTPCIDKNILGDAISDGVEQDIVYLSDAKRMCGGMKYGFPAGFDSTNARPENWNQVREGYVYFTGGGSSMNPGALKCFREFFEMAEAAGFQPCLSAALRTPAHQRSSCLGSSETVCGRGKGSGPKGCPSNLSSYLGCPHVKGYGIDINDKSGKLNALLAFARRSGKFSMVGVPGTKDIWHIEARNCGDPNFNPNPNLTDNWSGSSPSAGITNVLRGLFNSSGQQSAPSSAPGYTIPSSVSPQQVISVTAGTEPAQVSPSETTASPQFIGGVSSQLGATGTSTRASSTADRLEELAFGVRATTTQSPIYIPLVVTGAQAGGVNGNVQNQGMQPTAVAQLSPSLGQNTFVSADLSWQTGGFGYTAPVTGWQVTLMNITNVLRRILALLQPFGARSLGVHEEGVE